LVRRVGVLDIQAEEGGRVRPFRLGIEPHYHRVADPELGMPYDTALILYPCDLLRTKGLLDEFDQPGGIP
jgi:hypothetical protein